MAQLDVECKMGFMNFEHSVRVGFLFRGGFFFYFLVEIFLWMGVHMLYFAVVIVMRALPCCRVALLRRGPRDGRLEVYASTTRSESSLGGLRFSIVAQPFLVVLVQLLESHGAYVVADMVHVLSLGVVLLYFVVVFVTCA